MKKKVWEILSYVLVWVTATALTLFLVDGFGDLFPKKNEYSKLEELERVIDEYFIGEYDKSQMEDLAATAMVASLGDRWSYYLPAGAYEDHMEQANNAYVGIGITITAREDGKGFDIMQVNKGGPAEEAGLLPGDAIVGVEGQSTEGMSTEDARDLVRGAVGTQVLLTILRGEETLEVSVTRREVQTPVAAEQMLDNGMGLVTIYNFDARCADETIAAMESLLEQGATALIFDVRNNPGGYKEELVAVLDYLLPEGPLFRSEDYEGQVLVDESDERHLDIPMAVLVNENSYSAAEFFAAALSEYEAAVVVGNQTCGKGYYQTLIQLRDGSAVGLSIGKYTTPNGVSLAGVGITPDLVVEVDEQTALEIYYGTLAPETDPQIQAAVDALEKQ